MMRTKLTKMTLAAASTVLVLSGLAGCSSSDSGGDGDSDADSASTDSDAAPVDASEDDFCTAFNGLIGKVLSQIGTGDVNEGLAGLKDWAAEMEEIGTPAGMPDDARHGFEVIVEQAADIDDDATLEDLQNFGDDVDPDDQADAEAFGDWATDNCPSPLSDLSDLASELPSELASAVPSDLPSELSQLPSDLSTDLEELESMLSELTASAG